MKHLTDQQLAAELENRRNSLHNACQRDPAMRPVLGQILAVMHEAAIRLRVRQGEIAVRKDEAAAIADKEREIGLPGPPPPRKRGGPPRPSEA